MTMGQAKEKQAFLTVIKPFERGPHLIGRVPIWGVTIGLLLIGVIYFFLPDNLTVGPGWGLWVIEFLILLPLWVFWATGRALPHRLTRRMSLVLLGIVTLALAIGVIFLVRDVQKFKNGFTLLRTAGLLWTLNILVFALWYWDTDGGGPRKRHESGHKATDLMFPQQANGESWAPEFFDYLFLAFNTATAFSPTDTYPLTTNAKALMMIESIMSLIIVAILVSRVANIF